MTKKEGKNNKKKLKKLKWIFVVELILLIVVVGGYLYYNSLREKSYRTSGTNVKTNDSTKENKKEENKKDNELTKEQQEVLKEQERLKKQEQERLDLITEANKLVLRYEYDAAIDLIKTYEGGEGGYQIYKTLMTAIEGYEALKDSLVLYGGSYASAHQINHIFFHSLIADNSKAFDGDYKETGYNMYMTTISEFEKMMQKMYEDGYVLVSMHDIVKKVTLEDGTTKFVEEGIYLPKGKKPFVMSIDDVNYYEYMEQDGFASRIIIGEDGKPTCEMVMEDGSVVTGEFDVVPILDAFVEANPDFSYRGAKGILALTGYEGALGYRTNDTNSPTYEEDRESVKAVAKVLRENGWDFACHSWGHRNTQNVTDAFLRNDTDRWLEEVASLIGPTDIYIFPFGVEFENGIGNYSSEKFKILKERGFDYYCGVYKEPWMQIRQNYVRMSRRPLDGQALIQFPERLSDLFNVEEIIDPDRPERAW